MRQPAAYSVLFEAITTHIGAERRELDDHLGQRRRIGEPLSECDDAG